MNRCRYLLSTVAIVVRGFDGLLLDGRALRITPEDVSVSPAMNDSMLIGLVVLLWAAVIVVACLSEAALGDVEWPRRRRRPRRRATSWADDPRSHARSPEELEASRRSTLPAPPDEEGTS